MTWKPQLKADLDLTALPLDARQGFLMSQLDGATDVPTLAILMGAAEDEVADILEHLVVLGALEAPREALAAPAPEGPARPEAELEPDPPEADSGAEASADEASTATQRQRFETLLKAMTGDARVALARTADEPDLSALCFDPLPEVIQSLLENPRMAGLQARLVASHHRTSAGLEALVGRTAFAHDDGVRRALLRNPILPPALYRRLWSNRRLQEQFLVATSKEAPEQTRTMAREVLRTTFTQRQGEERAELIVNTEGRCLALLPTATLDGQATAILCRRTYSSTLFIQNLARWSACPPQLIAHLRRQDLVKRNTVLRQMLERHPNAS
ncbi:MAG: hypothetical protein HYZ13_07185 [Acidobacteria bacterium]|nr:hypothetical protein [Acidobacteriota bacterium]